MSSRYAKEFHRLKHNLEKKSNGQAFIKDWDPDNITTFIVEVTPRGGPYKQGKFLFQIIVPEMYPDVHPDVVCLTDIYHPNIDPDITDEHNICLNLFDEWNKSFGLEDCVQGLIFLLYNPNLMDPISAFFDGSTDSEESFVSKVQASLRGESFDGITFIKNPGFGEPDISPKALDFSEDSAKQEDGSEKMTESLSTEEKGAVGLINDDEQDAKKENCSEEKAPECDELPSSKTDDVSNSANSERPTEPNQSEDDQSEETKKENHICAEEPVADLLTSNHEGSASSSDVDAVISELVTEIVSAVPEESYQKEFKFRNRSGEENIFTDLEFAFRTDEHWHSEDDDDFDDDDIMAMHDEDDDDDDDEDDDDDDDDDDDGGGDKAKSSFTTDHMPYEELACSWNKEDLDEEHPFVDALGCRFLYQADSSSDEEDEDFSSTMEVDNSTEWTGEIIELNNSRLIIQPCYRNRDVFEIVFEQRDSPGAMLFPWLRRTLRQITACILPFERAIRQANAGFWEACIFWTVSLWLSGQFPPSRVTRITRMTCIR